MRPATIRILCVVYALFVLYGSLSPFDLRADAALAEANFRRAFVAWPFGPAHASRADILANIVLYAPFGALVALHVALRRGPGWLALLAAFDAALALSLAVETLQLLSLTRVSQGTDLLSNAAGGLLGAAGGLAVGPARLLRCIRRTRRRLTGRPAALAGTALACVIAAGAIYPFVPTQDVRAVWHHVRDSHYDVLEALGRRPWHGWAVHATVFAALAGLWAAAGDGPRRVGRAIGRTVAFAAACQAGRVFFLSLDPAEPSTANVAAVLVAAAGAVLGAALAAGPVGRLGPTGRRVLAAGLLLGAVAYAELVAPGPVLPPAALLSAPTAPAVRPLLRGAVLAAGLAAALRYAAPPARLRGGVLPWGLAAVMPAGACQAARWLAGGPEPSPIVLGCYVLGGWAGAVLAGPVARRLLRGHSPGPPPARPGGPGTIS